MLSLLSNPSKVHLVKGMMIPYEKGNLSFLAGTDSLYSIIICSRNRFYHNFEEIMLEKYFTADKCQRAFRVCSFHFKIPATLQKAQAESKTSPESSIC